MKKMHVVAALLLVVGLLMLPGTGKAEMVPLSDEQMGDVSGQAGISMVIDHLDVKMSLDTLYYGDEDGLGIGSNTSAGYLSLCGVVLDGSADFPTPLTIDIVTTAGANSKNVGLSSVSMTMTEMALKVNRFTIDAIRLGPEPGVGPSLGSLGIYNLTANITGHVQLFTH